MRFVHRVLSASRASGFTGVPELAKTEGGETVLGLAGRLYDAQEWLAGEPLSRTRADEGPTPNMVMSLSPARIADLAATLARFHRSTAHLSAASGNDTSALSLRLARATEVVAARYEALSIEAKSTAEGEERSVALRWLELLPGAVEAAREASEMLPEAGPEDYVVCHGDLWPAHVHFDGGTFVGFTDFESVCFASPVLDLAQLALHFGGWGTQQYVLRSYETVASLAGRDRFALPVEAVVDLAAEGYWSLEALYGNASSRTTSAQRATHVINLRELVGSLELIAAEMRRLGG